MANIISTTPRVVKLLDMVIMSKGYLIVSTKLNKIYRAIHLDIPWYVVGTPTWLMLGDTSDNPKEDIRFAFRGAGAFFSGTMLKTCLKALFSLRCL